MYMYMYEKVYATSVYQYCKTCVKRPLSLRPKIGFQDQSALNADQKYSRMLQVEHSAILSTFIKLQFVIKIFSLPFYTGFNVIKYEYLLHEQPEWSSFELTE